MTWRAAYQRRCIFWLKCQFYSCVAISLAEISLVRYHLWQGLPSSACPRTVSQDPFVESFRIRLVWNRWLLRYRKLSSLLSTYNAEFLLINPRPPLPPWARGDLPDAYTPPSREWCAILSASCCCFNASSSVDTGEAAMAKAELVALIFSCSRRVLK